jgi:hypothetical protein
MPVTRVAAGLMGGTVEQRPTTGLDVSGRPAVSSGVVELAYGRFADDSQLVLDGVEHDVGGHAVVAVVQVQTHAVDVAPGHGRVPLQHLIR